ncbi:amidohydrolase family protein [Vannielia litorea]|uniref:L-fuconolactonase n=1 Tax=Vannielia litorea TaxID=1217970 RepID=A0A1N6EKZ5_9RHOB|nr:amidohydrolase family protein [Vannielia litorea]SIN83678.1 L-fuconolactonase [Vannielia litorea]
MPITAIDAHVHIWDRSRGETFIAERQFPALTGKAFLPEDLAPVLAQTRAESAVLVHGPATVKHALHCLDLCHRHQVFRSVVGWVDLRDPDCGRQLAEQARDPAFRGLRFTPLLDADPEGYLRSAAALQTCGALRDHGALVEVLAPPPLFGAVAALAAAQPELPVVLAHFGLPDGDPAHFNSWRAAIAPLAGLPNLHVKLSGLPLDGTPEHDRALTTRHLDAMLALFGSDRLLYASNWPVATALATPGHWRNLLDEALEAAEVPSAGRKAIYRGNALRLY